MIVLGVDPGKFGGIALLRSKLRMAEEVIDIPIVGDKAKARVNVPELVRWLRDRPCDHAFVERAQAMPKQGASSGFLYGRCVGALEAVVQALDIPITIVEASAWKKHFKLPGGPENKDAARLRALQLYPHLASSLARKLDHGRAEAILIAHFGLSMLGVAPGYRAAA